MPSELAGVSHFGQPDVGSVAEGSWLETRKMFA